MDIFSSLQPQNLRLRRAIQDADRVAADERYPLIFDPQTAGGLLASVPDDNAGACLAELKHLGYAQAAIIGSVMPGGVRLEPVSIHRNGHG
jgi:selenide,water dikinase